MYTIYKKKVLEPLHDNANFHRAFEDYNTEAFKTDATFPSVDISEKQPQLLADDPLQCRKTSTGTPCSTGCRAPENIYPGKSGMCYLGSLYFHFSGKDEIAHEVLSEATAEFMAFLSNVLGGKNPGACIDHKKHLKHGEIP